MSEKSNNKVCPQCRGHGGKVTRGGQSGYYYKPCALCDGLCEIAICEDEENFDHCDYCNKRFTPGGQLIQLGTVDVLKDFLEGPISCATIKKRYCSSQCLIHDTSAELEYADKKKVSISELIVNRLVIDLGVILVEESQQGTVHVLNQERACEDVFKRIARDCGSTVEYVRFVYKQERSKLIKRDKLK